MRRPPLPQLLLGLAAVAAAIALAGHFAADAIVKAKRSNDTITVTGSARQPITADQAQWSLSVAVQAPTPGAAAKALAGYDRRARDFLGTSGLPASAVNAPPFSTETLEERRADGTSTGVVAGYRLTQYFTVTSDDIERVETLAASLSDLLSEGVPASANSIQYVSTKLADARLAALEQATRNARERAETIVRNLGGTLGKARSAQLGVYQVVPRNSTDVSDYGINNTTTRDKDVVSVVSLTFAVR
jgi:hypothetical protein